jgi:hypothetical protein
MRILKTLAVFFAILLISPSAFAQSEPSGFTPFQEDPPTFSVGFSLGFPSSYHVSILDIAGVQGLRLRGDLGAFTLIFLSVLQVDLNIEYHFAKPREVGFYFGVGVVAFSFSVIGEFPNPDNGAWRFGGQIYLGLDLGSLFLEVGIVQSFTGSSNGVQTLPRIVIGYNFYR